ncbi:Mannosyltransferase APTG1-like protein [Drosera capensis]
MRDRDVLARAMKGSDCRTREMMRTFIFVVFGVFSFIFKQKNLHAVLGGKNYFSCPYVMIMILITMFCWLIYGHLTWEWKKGIRSYLHPLLFSLLYKLLALFHLDTPAIMMKAPRVFQALFAAIGDLYLYKLSDVLFGHRVAQWADPGACSYTIGRSHAIWLMDLGSSQFSEVQFPFFSILGHKEFSGYLLAAIESADSSIRKRKQGLRGRNTWRLHLAIFLLLVTNIPMALYMSMVHQRGTEDVMGFLSRQASNGEVKPVLFLMSCHSTPCYSALHRNLPMRFLDCTPSEEQRVPDESDRFMMDPPGFALEFVKNWSLPSHIVLFDSEEKKLKDFLMSHSFVEVERLCHAHFKVDRDLQPAVVVYALRSVIFCMISALDMILKF